jgi:hypothetical protein
MRCHEALERLLVADDDELAGESSSSLGVHVAGCGRCGAVAARLRQDTSAIAMAVARDDARDLARRRSPSIPAWTRMLPLGVAAGVAALMLRTPGTADDAPVRDPAPAVAGPSTSDVAPSPASDEPAPPPVATSRAARTPRAAADLGRDVSRDLRPFEPVRLGGHDAVSAGPVTNRQVIVDAVEVENAARAPGQHVSVVPPAGERALVARTSDPRITVVWLYR